ncbi:MAG TPA: hypothetical protein VGG31_05190 [Candidatus Dormibacteraeota bacterium]|jgi:hypothetical protein
MVSGYIEEGHVKPADEVLEIVERQVAAGDREVGPQRGEPICVQRLVDLVRDREDASQGLVRRA